MHTKIARILNEDFTSPDCCFGDTSILFCTTVQVRALIAKNDPVQGLGSSVWQRIGSAIADRVRRITDQVRRIIM
jgi:hypothetical protein